MTLQEIEFELSAEQYEVMGYPGLRQGQALTLTLDGGVLLPDPGAAFWYTVQKDPLPQQFQKIGPALYAFAGQIDEADIQYGQEQFAHLSINCGNVFLRATCAPGADGMLPYGTWETRYIFGISPLQGLIEESFDISVGRNVNVTLWNFRRLILRPADSDFGRWHESVQIPPSPFQYDRIYVTARLHRNVV
jgi:hypothetical protein